MTSQTMVRADGRLGAFPQQFQRYLNATAPSQWIVTKAGRAAGHLK